MSDLTRSDLTSWRAKRAALAALLDEPDAADQRDSLKENIIALYKAVDHHIGELTTLRDDVKALVEKWKTLEGASIAPQFAAARPNVHADHIGASTFVEKGWSRLSLGDYEGAEQALHRAIALSPGDPQSEALLGWAQMLQEKYDEALANFHRVLAREPHNALARINVGYISLKKGAFGEAIEHLSRAIRLDNDKKATLYAHFYLGLVYLEREMYEDAENFFRKTLALGPNLIEAYYELGRALWYNDERAAARDAWREGHTANRFNPWGKKCAEVLAVVDAGGEPPRNA